MALKLMMNSQKWVDVLRNPPAEVRKAWIAPNEKEAADILYNTEPCSQNLSSGEFGIV